MTNSESLLTKINTGLFFREFTYANNQLTPEDGLTKELADNIVWLDDLLIAFQVKERDRDAVGDLLSEEKWFDKKVVKAAKKQINDTLTFFETMTSLPITNERGQRIDIVAAKEHPLVKVIIYDPSSNILESKRRLTFLESSNAGLIHLFHIDDYQLICEYLITPAELGQYLDFRQRMFTHHGALLLAVSERYLLGHFIATEDELEIDTAYEADLQKLPQPAHAADIAHLINNFKDKLVMLRNGGEHDYHFIIREIAKLHRGELFEFRSRYIKAIKQAAEDQLVLPWRFATKRTDCGFVFCSITLARSADWENALINFTAGFKYKHKLPKCVGMIVFKDGPYYEIRWTYLAGAWELDQELEEMVQKEAGHYGPGYFEFLLRYPLKN